MAAKAQAKEEARLAAEIKAEEKARLAAEAEAKALGDRLEKEETARAAADEVLYGRRSP